MDNAEITTFNITVSVRILLDCMDKFPDEHLLVRYFGRDIGWPFLSVPLKKCIFFKRRP